MAFPVLFFMWLLMGGLGLVGYNEWITELIGKDPTQEMVLAMQEEQDPATLLMLCMVAVIGAPFSEEVVFRGYIYPTMKRFVGVTGSVLFSAALFSAVHLNLGALLPLFVLGVILAVSYEMTGSLWMPIAIHLVFNLATVVVQMAKKMSPELQEQLEQKAREVAILWGG